MKRSKVLALVLVVSIMLMGAGYAAWTETLTINHTVSTGNVDVDLLDGNVKVYAGAIEAGVDSLERTVSVVGGDLQTATVTVTNLYPGATAVVTIPVKNNSTIPVEKLGATAMEGVPAWLTVTDVCPPSLTVGQQDNIVLTMLVGEAPEKVVDVKFNLKPVYTQWNAK